MTAPTERDVRARGLLSLPLAGLLVAATFLTSCSVSDEGGNESTGTAPERPATSTPPAQPPSRDDAGPRTGRGAGDAVVLTDVRGDERDGFDRIVLEFSGTGTPGWRVAYVEEPMLEGSGEVVELTGASILAINASNTTWPAPDYYAGPTRPEAEPGAPDLYVGGTFEGYTQVFAGVDDADAPFRVFTLTDPSRLVIDIATSD